VLQGLIFIKYNCMLHKNLKPSNIFLDPQAKIGDYVLSKVFKGYKEYPYPTTNCFTYMSPELLEKNEVNTSTDIWSLGCIVYEMCCFTVTTCFHYSLCIMLRVWKSR